LKLCSLWRRLFPLVLGTIVNAELAAVAVA
jgi:hypothetical protein